MRAIGSWLSRSGDAPQDDLQALFGAELEDLDAVGTQELIGGLHQGRRRTRGPELLDQLARLVGAVFGQRTAHRAL